MIGVIDYGVGNLGSIVNMLRRIGVDSEIIRTENQLQKAGGLILPGVGHFSHCMEKFNAFGLRAPIEELIAGKNLPLLGICVGMQMLFAHSEEGDVPGLGWLPGNVINFCFDDSDKKDLKIPHMGWNHVRPQISHSIMDELGPDNRFYFVHSYHPVCDNPGHVIGTSSYGYNFPCVVGNKNVIGVQFHPEKSHRYGMQLLKNFASRICSSSE